MTPKYTEQDYYSAIKVNISLKRSHTEFINRLIKKNPADREIILAAEARVFNKMRG